MPYYCNTEKTNISDGYGEVGLDQVVDKLGVRTTTRDDIEYVNIEDLLTTYCSNEDRTLLKYFTKQVGTAQSAPVFKGSSAADGDFGLVNQEVRAQLDPGNTFSQQGVDLPAFTVKGGSPHFRQLIRLEANINSVDFTRTKDKLTIGSVEFSKNSFSDSGGVIPTVFLIVLVGGGGGGGGGDHWNSGAGGGGGCTVIGTVSFLHISEGRGYTLKASHGGLGAQKYNTGENGYPTYIEHLRGYEGGTGVSMMSANGGKGGESGSNTARQGGAGGQYSLDLGNGTADAHNQIFRIIDFISGGRGGDHNNGNIGVWPLANPYVSSCTTKNDKDKTLSFPERYGGTPNLSGGGGYSAYANGGAGGAAYSDGSPGTLGSGGGGGVYENFGGGYTGGSGGDGFIIIYY